MSRLKAQATRYSQAFSGADKLADSVQRLRKAEKIRAILAQEHALPQTGTSVLDIGCSYGLILQRLVAGGGLGVGVDLDQYALGKLAAQVVYAQADGEQLPFPARHFDVILCNHVYEHTDAPERLMAEIARVLKPDGLCYFAGPNKYALLEPHYRLPFLSWLPQPLATVYLRMLGLADGYTIQPYSRSALQRLLAPFDILDYTGTIVADPARYWVDDLLPPGSLKQWLARCVLRWLPAIFPDFVLVLRRRKGEDA